MFNRFILSIILSWAAFVLPAFFCSAQEIVKFGFRPSDGVRTLFFDTISNKLFVGGNFDSLLTEQGTKLIDANKIAVYDGVKWDSLDNSPIHKSYVIAIDRIFGKLTFGGTGGVHVLNDSNRLERLKLGGDVIEMIEINDTAFFIGGDNISTHNFHKDSLNGLVLYKDTTFFRLKNHPNFVTNANFSSFLKFKGNYYLAGNFHEPIPSLLEDIMMYDGQNWLPLGDGLNGGTWVYDMIEFQNELYVGGNFKKLGNWPIEEGNNIAKWDGEKWHSVGSLGYPGQQVVDFHVVDSILFAVGLFESANFQIPASHLVAWNGKRLCSYNFEFGHINSISSNDTILFIGGWNVYEGEALIGIKNFRNFHYCTTPLSINEKTRIKLNSDFQIFPNPANNLLTINSLGLNLLKINIFNVTGQLVYENTFFDKSISIDLSNIQSGIFLIQTTFENGEIKTKKFIKTADTQHAH